MFGGMKIPPKMLTGKKSELKLGHIVKLRNGEFGKIAQNELHCNGRYIDMPIEKGIAWLDNYNDNLKFIARPMEIATGHFYDEHIPKWDIVAIYEETWIGSFLHAIQEKIQLDDIHSFNKVWERKTK